MDRREFQELSKVRLKEAAALLKAGFHDGAFYLAGYAVECGLKACIAKRTRRGEFPDKKRAESSHSHDLSQLMKVGGLEGPFRDELAKNPDFLQNWEYVRSWSEQSRYRRYKAEDARGLLEAIENRRHGVLSWIKQHW